jgi:hypothetical protein
MRRQPPTMTHAQHHALMSAGPDGRLTVTHRGILGALIRRGWVRAVETRRRRKTVTHYEITGEGLTARDAVPVAPPRARPLWRESWTVTPVRVGRCYIVDCHKLVLPGRDMLWRVLCPSCAADQPVGYCETLADAVERLARHLIGADCPRSGVTPPVDPDELPPAADDTDDGQTVGLIRDIPLDLDALTQTDAPAPPSGESPQLSLF